MKKEELLMTIRIIFIFILLWIGITTMCQAYWCHKMTNTELFFHLPKSLIFDYEHCN